MTIHEQIRNIESKEFDLFEQKLSLAIQKAYQQGVEDCREAMKSELLLPSNLRKEHVAKIFQCELPTVEKIIRMDGFPKCHALSARYPRDKVLEWRDKNTMYMNSRLGIYVSENESLRLLRA